MATKTATIIWTKIDEAPALATYSFLPIVHAFTKGTGVAVETRDISLAGRIIANFPDYLTEKQRIPDYLAQLGELALTPEANIIKLPTSALPSRSDGGDQGVAGARLQPPGLSRGTEDRRGERVAGKIREGSRSAVNPVLRQGNSDRRAPLSVKQFSKKHPHKMGAWAKDSKIPCRPYDRRGFYGSEEIRHREETDEPADRVRRRRRENDRLKKKLDLLEGEVIDATVMNVAPCGNSSKSRSRMRRRAACCCRCTSRPP